jgi:hypothetical protein
MTKPRSQDISANDIPEVTDDDGTRVRVIIGDFWGRSGPVEGVAADPRYLDVSVPPGKTKRLAVDRANNAFAYVFAGSGTFRDASDPQAVATELVGPSTLLGAGGPAREVIDLVSNRSLVVFDRGDEIVVRAGDEGIRFLLVSGKPLEEPVAWRGPIVMNSNVELQQAYAELRAGTFIK